MSTEKFKGKSQLNEKITKASGYRHTTKPEPV